MGASQKGRRPRVDARWLTLVPRGSHEMGLVAAKVQRPPLPHQRTSRASTSVTCAAPGRMPPRRDAAASSLAPSGAPLPRRPADHRCVDRKTVLKPVRGSTPITHGVTGRPVRRAQPARSTHTSASNMAATKRLANRTNPMAMTTRRNRRLTTPATKSFKRHLSFTTWDADCGAESHRNRLPSPHYSCGATPNWNTPGSRTGLTVTGITLLGGNRPSSNSLDSGFSMRC